MPLLRPRDADALRAEMRHVVSVAGVPVMFGGEVHDDTLLLTEFLGTRTAGLRGLAVRPSAGLGGATVVARRPMSVADYRRASTITHDYDAPVLGEGIRSILAVPVVVGGQARAVLYGAYRSRGTGRRPHGGCDGGFRAAIEPRADCPRRGRSASASAGGAAGEFWRRSGQHREAARGARRTAPPRRGHERHARRPRSTARPCRAAGRGDVARRADVVFAADLRGSRRALPGGAWLHQCRSGATSFAAPRDGEKLSAQRGGKAGHSHPPRGGVGGAAGAADAQYNPGAGRRRHRCSRRGSCSDRCSPPPTRHRAHRASRRSSRRGR